MSHVPSIEQQAGGPSHLCTAVDHDLSDIDWVGGVYRSNGNCGQCMLGGLLCCYRKSGNRESCDHESYDVHVSPFTWHLLVAQVLGSAPKFLTGCS